MITNPIDYTTIAKYYRGILKNNLKKKYLQLILTALWLKPTKLLFDTEKDENMILYKIELFKRNWNYLCIKCLIEKNNDIYDLYVIMISKLFPEYLIMLKNKK